MTGGNFIKRGIIPLVVVAIILYVGQYFYIVDGQIDWLRLIMVVGIPVGIPYMFIVIPVRWELSGLLGMIVFCIIIGAIGGFVIACFLVVRATIYVVG